MTRKGDPEAYLQGILSTLVQLEFIGTLTTNEKEVLRLLRNQSAPRVTKQRKVKT